MKIDTSKLPTHIALVCRRFNICNPDDLAARFLEASYVAEATLKTIACVLHAGLEKPAREIAYRHAYEFVRADGLGLWESSIRDLTTPPTASYLPPEYSSLLNWIAKKRTKNEDELFCSTFDGLRSVLSLLGADDNDRPKTVSVRELMSVLVQIRNKTKAHGAVGEEFYAAANAPYFAAVIAILKTCPAFSWKWMYLSKRESGKTRGIALTGLETGHIKDSECASFSFEHSGVCVAPEQSTRVFPCSVLLRSNRECTSFLLPNGGMKSNGACEFIDYGSGAVERVELPEFTSPPAQRPPSDTEGLGTFDVQSNVFGNLPVIPPSYVRRGKLEADLTARLRDRNHPIITLHGGGGMGKTSIP